MRISVVYKGYLICVQPLPLLPVIKRYLCGRKKKNHDRVSISFLLLSEKGESLPPVGEQARKKKKKTLESLLMRGMGGK